MEWSESAGAREIAAENVEDDYFIGAGSGMPQTGPTGKAAE